MPGRKAFSPKGMVKVKDTAQLLMLQEAILWIRKHTSTNW